MMKSQPQYWVFITDQEWYVALWYQGTSWHRSDAQGQLRQLWILRTSVMGENLTI